jgi:hypothetical protein
MTSNLSLFSFAILKTLLGTVGPGLILAGIFEKCPFPFCVRREFHREGHAVRIPVERFEAKEQPGLFKASGGRQLAHIGVIDSSESNRATSLPRKVSARRTA